MGAFEDKLMDAGLPQGGLTTDEAYKNAVVPTTPINANPMPVIGPPTAEQYLEQQQALGAVQEQLYGYMPTINRKLGIRLPLSGTPNKSPYAANMPIPQLEDEGNYRFMGRPATKEEIAADQAEEAKQAQQIKHETKYFRPELAQVPQREFEKNQQLMRKLGAIQEEKANIEAAKLQNESMMVQQQADMLQRNAAEAEQRDKEFFNLASAKQREIDKKVQEVGDYKYNPRRVISDAGTLEKMGMIAGAMLGGYMQVMTKSGENQFLKAMDKIVQDEADKQEKELGQKRYMANEAVNSYQRLMQDYKDRDTVRSVRESQIYKAMQTQIMSQALASGSATAIKNAEEANAMMDLRIQQNEMARWQSMYYNPDLVRGGGGGAAKLKKIEEGAQRYGEELQKMNIPGLSSLIAQVESHYVEGGNAADRGRLKGRAIDTAYAIPGARMFLSDETIAEQQDWHAFKNAAIKEATGKGVTKEDAERINNQLEAAQDAPSKLRAIQTFKNVMQKQASNVGGTVDPESIRLYNERQKNAEKLNLTPTPNMPESTKKAGQ